jgi:hypothetical protein
VDMASTLKVGSTITINDPVQTTFGLVSKVKSVYLSSTDATYANLTIRKEAATSTDYLQIRNSGNALLANLTSLGGLITAPTAGGHAVFNEGGIDADFRVESATTANALFVEGSSGNVGIGTTPSLPLHVNSTTSGLPVTSGTTQTNGVFRLSSSATSGIIDFGMNGSNPWIQATDSTGLNTNYNLILNPNGGDVGIGSSTANHFSITGTANVLGVKSSSGALVSIAATGTNFSGIDLGTDSIRRAGVYSLNGSVLGFYTNPTNSGSGMTERMSIDSSGGLITTPTAGGHAVFNEGGIDADFRVESVDHSDMFNIDAFGNVVAIGKTGSTGGASTEGAYFSHGASQHFHLVMTNESTDATHALLYLNRQSVDNSTLVNFMQADTVEGSITVNGSTVSYNGFSGRHESSGIPLDTPLGTVVSTIDELDVYPDRTTNVDGNAIDHLKAGQTRADHAKVEVSTSTGDACVYGVVSEFDGDGKLIVTSVGIGSIRVTGACSKGDLLESNGDGTAKVQSDDIIRSKTIGKVTIGNSDTGVKLVACVMYCG